MNDHPLSNSLYQAVYRFSCELCLYLFFFFDESVYTSLHCSVMTPYYSEETVYSKTDLEMENEDGVSIIYYLQKIYPGFFKIEQF